MVHVTFYYGTEGSQQVIWDVKKWEIKNPLGLAKDWAHDLGASSYKIERIKEI